MPTRVYWNTCFVGSIFGMQCSFPRKDSHIVTSSPFLNKLVAYSEWIKLVPPRRKTSWIQKRVLQTHSFLQEGSGSVVTSLCWTPLASLLHRQTMVLNAFYPAAPAEPHSLRNYSSPTLTPSLYAPQPSSQPSVTPALASHRAFSNFWAQSWERSSTDAGG